MKIGSHTGESQAVMKIGRHPGESQAVMKIGRHPGESRGPERAACAKRGVTGFSITLASPGKFAEYRWSRRRKRRRLNVSRMSLMQ
jgi:hypothetical protein